MRTCGMMGEIVGKAAYLAVLHKTSPRGVYEAHLPELIDLAKQPGATRRDSLTGESRLDLSIPSIGKLPVGKMNRDLPQYATRLNTGEAELETLPGIVVDDSVATFTGKWEKTTLAPNVGGSARYAGRQAEAVARYEFKVPSTGKYEVRVYWAGHENRASNTPCSLERAGQPAFATRLNQKANGPKGATVLGVFDFAQGAANAVVLSTAGADGNIVADAVQIVAVR
jgi:hypothetical protein